LWPDDEAWYLGTIEGWDEESGTHTVRTSWGAAGSSGVRGVRVRTSWALLEAVV
jgi:hypothetical protein